MSQKPRFTSIAASPPFQVLWLFLDFWPWRTTCLLAKSPPKLQWFGSRFRNCFRDHKAPLTISNTGATWYKHTVYIYIIVKIMYWVFTYTCDTQCVLYSYIHVYLTISCFFSCCYLKICVCMCFPMQKNNCQLHRCCQGDGHNGDVFWDDCESLAECGDYWHDDSGVAR